MRDREEIVSKLPYLRRYARALTGSQAIGDQYVRICLEVLVEDPTRLPDKVDLQRELFRLFHRVWTRVSPEMAYADALHHDDGDLAVLNELSGLEREVLLLISLEGYSFADAAYILGIDEDEARRYFNDAQADVAQHAAVPIMIIEDEKIIAFDLKSIVEKMGHRVCGVAAREGEAITLAAQARPRLILADIQLKDGGSGIVAVRKILEEIDVPVIFITAYPEYLLTGNAPEPAFVITKPFSHDTVMAAISQALFVNDRARPAELAR